MAESLSEFSLSSVAFRARAFARAATTTGIQRRALVVGLVVGTLLNAINQGDSIVAGHIPNLAKVFFTYLVPYCVATYGGATAIAASVLQSASEFEGRDRTDGFDLRDA